MITRSIAKRYTQALFDLSQEKNVGNEIHKDLQKIQELIDQTPQLRAFLCSPIIPTQKRQGILQNIFEKRIHKLLYQFICFLNTKNRLDLLNDICHAFDSMYLETHDIVKVNITSGITLNKTQVEEISLHLKSRFKKNIEPEFNLDPSMLAGVTIQKGDTIYDYSLQAQLEEFRNNILKA